MILVFITYHIVCISSVYVLTTASDLFLQQTKSYKEIWNQFVFFNLWVDTIFFQIVRTGSHHDFVVHPELPGVALGIRAENRVRCITHDFWCPASIHHVVPSKHILDRCCCNSGTWPEAIHADTILTQFCR